MTYRRDGVNREGGSETGRTRQGSGLLGPATRRAGALGRSPSTRRRRPSKTEHLEPSKRAERTVHGVRCGRSDIDIVNRPAGVGCAISVFLAAGDAPGKGAVGDLPLRGRDGVQVQFAGIKDKSERRLASWRNPESELARRFFTRRRALVIVLRPRRCDQSVCGLTICLREGGRRSRRHGGGR